MRIESISDDESRQASRFRLRFDRPTVTRGPTGLVSVQLEGVARAGEVGGPRLPRSVLRVALPPGVEAVSVELEGEQTTLLTDAPALVVPEARPRLAAMAPRSGDPAAGDEMTRVDERLYQAAIRT